MSNIKVGDLVVVVRCCCMPFFMGKTIFHVAKVWRPIIVDAKCAFCDSEMPKDDYVSPYKDWPGAPASWLKRIPPLEKLDEKRVYERLNS